MKDDDFYLKGMLSANSAINDYTREGRRAFFNQNIIQDAVLYNLTIIGEAARRISPTKQISFPQVSWKEMIGMRNYIVHEYHNVDLELTWQTIENDLPVLKKQLEMLTKV